MERDNLCNQIKKTNTIIKTGNKGQIGVKNTIKTTRKLTLANKKLRENIEYNHLLKDLDKNLPSEPEQTDDVNSLDTNTDTSDWNKNYDIKQCANLVSQRECIIQTIASKEDKTGQQVKAKEIHKIKTKEISKENNNNIMGYDSDELELLESIEKEYM